MVTYERGMDSRPTSNRVWSEGSCDTTPCGSRAIFTFTGRG